jgi:hypothetical protein
MLFVPIGFFNYPLLGIEKGNTRETTPVNKNLHETKYE